jgi:hypothetical protein
VKYFLRERKLRVDFWFAGATGETKYSWAYRRNGSLKESLQNRMGQLVKRHLPSNLYWSQCEEDVFD